MRYGIYKITNLINNKSYIGQSIHIETRWGQEKRDAEYSNRPAYNKALSQDIRDFGWENFSLEIIEDCEPEKLNEREEYWILFYDTLQPKGYNSALINHQIYERNSDLLFNNHQEVKDILKNTSKPLKEIAQEFGVGISTIECINYGRTWTDPNETYPLRRGNKRNKVAQFTLTGELINEYDSIAVAARETGIDNSSITKVCNGKRNQAGGFRWARID